MPRPRDKYEREHQRRIEEIQRRIDAIYAEAIKEAAAIGVTIDMPADAEKAFSFDDYPLTEKRVEELLESLRKQLHTAIVNSVRSSWTLANNKNNELCNVVFGSNVGKLTQEQYRRYYSTNDKAREAFIERKRNGLSLSDNVWDYTRLFKREIEMGLDLGIREGKDAASMARDLKQYLQHPDKLFRRVRDEHGNLHLSKAAADFHPGRGVYRSSYMNARRLAATETNIAYRTADHERMKNLDFVVGIEIHLSHNHTCKGRDGKPHPFTDICNELEGKYPKDFKFTGWHPHCRCYVTSILKTDEEIAEDTKKILRGEPVDGESENTVEDVPSGFNDWVDGNKERAKGWETMPFFIRQNPQYVQGFEVDTYSDAERVFTRARRTKEAMSESLGIFLQSKYPEIPNTEKAAIYHYTQGNRSAYRQLNKQLRDGNLSEFNEAFSELLSKGLSKLPAIETTSYRTIRLNKTRLREFYELAEKQSETTFKGFTSTSLERSKVIQFAEAHSGRKKNETDILLVIQGKSGHRIEDFSQFGGRFSGKVNQQEVLFDKGCKFRFEGMQVENEWPVFYLTEL